MLNIGFHYWMALTTHPGVPPSDVILTEVNILLMDQFQEQTVWEYQVVWMRTVMQQGLKFELNLINPESVAMYMNFYL